MSPQALALVTSVSYAMALVCSRLGLKYSTPTTVTLVSILVQNAVLWTAVSFLTGIPPVSWVSVSLFCIVGVFQLGVRLLAYTGVLKIGASRSSALQSINPLISATIAIGVLSDGTYACWDSARSDRSHSRLLESGAGTVKFSLVALVAPGWRSDSLRCESSDAALRA